MISIMHFDFHMNSKECILCFLWPTYLKHQGAYVSVLKIEVICSTTLQLLHLMKSCTSKHEFGCGVSIC